MRTTGSFVIAATIVLAAGCGDGGDEVGAAAPDAPAADSPTATAPAPDATAAPTDEAPATFATQLSVGDCFNDQLDDAGRRDHSGPPAIVDCGAPHDNEVVAVQPYDAGPGAAYPSDDEWGEVFGDICVPPYQEYVGIDGAPLALNGFYVGPTEEEWADGARAVMCAAYLPDGRLVGSVEDVGNRVFPASFPDGIEVPDGIQLSSTGAVEDSYSPADSFVEDNGIDPTGWLEATFEGGPIDEAKAEVVAALEAGGWTLLDEYQWSGDVGTAYYGFERDGQRIVVETWELADGDSRVHYFYPGS